MIELSQKLGLARQSHGAALMGVLNLTPDSFFDGGRYSSAESAEARIDALLGEGSDIIDIGGESSRPSAKAVPADEQKARIEHALRYCVERGALVSVDTADPEVAEFSLRLGARIVNDISCLANVELARVAAKYDAALILTHSRGPMSHMAGFSEWPDDDYDDVVAEVLEEWTEARGRACREGLRRDAVWFDPGLGFSKNARQSLELLRRLDEFSALGVPVVVGPGRKSFIASVDPSPPEKRLGGTIASCLAAVLRGAWVLRIHDVREVRQALALGRATKLTDCAHA